MIKRFVYVLIIYMMAVSFSIGQAKIKFIVADTSSLDSEEDDIGAMCSLGCAIGWKVKASSELPSQGKNSYKVENLDDGKLKTAWVEGNSDYGIGETITFSFPRQYFIDSHIGDSVAFHGFRIVNGYIKDRSTWESNSRVKKLRVFHNQQAIMDIVLTDCMALQEAESICIFYLKPDDKIVVKILEVYPGKKYKDTALTELIPQGAH